MKKLMLLTLTAISAAILAVPTLASAGEWTLQGGSSQNFTVSSAGHTTLKTNKGAEVTCTSASGGGTVDAAGTGGTLFLTAVGCKETANATFCTTPELSSGTIMTSGAWTSAYLTDNKTNPGIRIKGTGETESLALFKCAFSLVTIRVEGTLIGEVEEECGTSGKEFHLNFESAEPGVQSYMQNTETGEKTDLTAYRNGVPQTASQNGTGTIVLEKSSTLHCD